MKKQKENLEKKESQEKFKTMQMGALIKLLLKSLIRLFIKLLLQGRMKYWEDSVSYGPQQQLLVRLNPTGHVDGKNDSPRIVPEIKIWPCWQIAYEQTRGCLRKRDQTKN